MNFITKINDSQKVANAGLLLRLSLAFLFLAHVYLKLFIFKPAGTVHFFQSLGLPGITAYIIILVEVLGAVLLLLGLLNTITTIILSLDLWGAIFLVHAHAGFWFTNQGGGAEYPLLWIVALYALAFVGPGKFALRVRNKNLEKLNF
jgi:putative oxidoreductase